MLSDPIIVTILPYVEALSHIFSGPVLALIGFMALKQIRVAEKTLRIGALRDSHRIATDQVNVYLSNIIPKIITLDACYAAEKDRLFKQCKFEVLSDKISCTMIFSDTDRNFAIANGTTIVECLNALEAFASPFRNGIASEQVAFRSLGVTFSHAVTRFLPLIMIGRGEHYQCIIWLYVLWQNRLKHSELTKKMVEVQDGLQQTKTFTIKPIGTD